jgi:hypothetical protein
VTEEIDEHQDLGDRERGDRGGGIHVTFGDFRLRDIHLSFDATTGELVESSMIPELRTDTFQHWLQISEEAAESAKEPRRRALEIPRDDGEAFTAALEEEFRASVVAITAGAIAVDSFYASVKQHAPQTQVPADARDAAIFETLKRAFVLTAEQQREAREPLRQIFRLRDEAVHPPASWAEPLPHPVFNVGIAPRFVWCRVENAILAHSFAGRLIWLCLNIPKPEHSELERWCREISPRIPRPPDPPAWVRADAGAEPAEDDG